MTRRLTTPRERRKDIKRPLRWSLVPCAILAAAVMVLAAVLYRILLSLERDTRQVQAEYRDNVAWYAGQFERELSALVQTLDSYHLGEAGVTKDDLAERMDVFWSRVDSAGSGTVGATFMSFEGVPPLIAEARRALRDIEPVVLALQPGDATAHQMIKQRLDGLPSAFHAAALLALHQQNGDMAGLHRRMAKGHSELLLIFAGVLTGSAILIGLILFKMQQVSALSASLERRVEQRTQHLRQEIGERQRAAEALRDSEQRFRDFASSASDWFWELAPDLRFSFLSERFEQATGIPPGQVLGKSHDEVGQPDQRDEVWVRHLEDVAARRPFRDFRLVQFQPDGTPVYVSLNGTPRFDEAGGFLGYRGTGTNISEQVEAERALRRSEERYRRLVDLSPDGIMIHVQDRIVFANPAAVRLLGARRAHDLIGRDILDFVEPRFHKSAKLRMREALDKGRKQPQMEQILVGLDGRTFPAQCSATRLPREEGRAVLTVFRDITEVKQGEANLRRSP